MAAAGLWHCTGNRSPKVWGQSLQEVATSPTPRETPGRIPNQWSPLKNTPGSSVWCYEQGTGTVQCWWGRGSFLMEKPLSRCFWDICVGISFSIIHVRIKKTQNMVLGCKKLNQPSCCASHRAWAHPEPSFVKTHSDMNSSWI